jgi:hypothetical protein
VLNRRARSYGRDTGWELEMTSGDPPTTTIENEVAYGYAAATGFLDTVGWNTCIDQLEALAAGLG